MSKLIHIRPHAKKQLLERNIEEDLVLDIIKQPGQIVDSYNDRKVAQEIIEYAGEQFLIRIVYEETNSELQVVTVYLTKKIEKYWRGMK